MYWLWNIAFYIEALLGGILWGHKSHFDFSGFTPLRVWLCVGKKTIVGATVYNCITNRK